MMIGRIAVCICGQLGRLFLETTIPHLFAANPSFSFTLFFHLQRSHIHNTGYEGIRFEPSQYLNYTSQELQKEFNYLLFHPQSNTHFGDMILYEEEERRKKGDWLKALNVSMIDRIGQFRDASYNYLILEMYKHHVDCADRILAFERKQQQQEHELNLTVPPSQKQKDGGNNEEQNKIFDYILLMREDLYFFSPVNFTNLIGSMKESKTAVASSFLKWDEQLSTHDQNALLHSSELFENYQQSLQKLVHHSSLRTGYNRACDVITKDCLKWGGINIRFEVFIRNAGIATLHSRLAYYQYLVKNDKEVFNPEQFDQTQISTLGLKSCSKSSNELPFAVARVVTKSSNTQDINYCFMQIEIFDREEHCYPPVNQSFIFNHFCEKYMKIPLPIRQKVKIKISKNSPKPIQKYITRFGSARSA